METRAPGAMIGRARSLGGLLGLVSCLALLCLGFASLAPVVAQQLPQWSWAQFGFAALALTAVLAPERLKWLSALLERRPRLPFAAASGAVLVVFVAWKLRQHSAFETTALDLSLYHQAVASLARGQGFDVPLLGKHLFAEHFSPAVAINLPLYWAWPDARALLVVHAAVLWVAPLPLAAAARRLGASMLEVWLVAFGCWLNPFLWRTLKFDVHPEALFLPAATLAVWAVVTRRWWLYWVSAALALLVKEDGALLVVGVGVALWWQVRAARRHLALGSLAAAGAMAIVLALVLPAFQNTSSSHFVAERWGSLGSGYGEVAANALSRPSLWWEWVSGRPVRTLLASVGVAPWAAPSAILGALPPLVLMRSSDYEPQSQLGLYYGLPALAVLLASLPFALARLRRIAPTAALVAATSLAWPLGAWRTPAPLPEPSAADVEAGEVLAALPAGARVAADNRLHPHLPPLEGHVLQLASSEVDVIAAPGDLEAFLMPREALRALLLQRLDEGWGVTTMNETLVLLRRGAPGSHDGALRARLGPPP